MKAYYKKNWPYFLGGLIVFVIILFKAQGEGDFNIFISASRDLLLGKNIYTIQYNEWYHYYYDLLFALALVPFTYFPLYVAKFIWLLLNVFFVYRIWKILTDWLPLSLLSKVNKTLFISLSFIFILSLLHDNFHLAQLTIFILYLTLEGIYRINNGKKITGSLLLAIGINIKLLPLVIIPYLIYRKEWKATFYVIGFMIICLCIPIAFLGYDYTQYLLIERWHLINPMTQAHILDTSERSFHSLTTLLATLLVEDCGDYHALDLKRNIANISIEHLNIVINIVRAALILFTLYFLRTKSFKGRLTKIQKLYEISYLCLIVPLIFPHQQHYAFFFIFPASTYVLFFMINMYFNKPNVQIIHSFKLKKAAFVVLVITIYFLLSSHFILGEFNHFYDHYKTLTYGALILMVLLAFCRPNKLFLEEEMNNSNLSIQ